jgi:SAM-dependent methyltransferase
MSTTALPRPIDPFVGSRAGRYEDDAVVVLRRDSLTPRDGERWTAVTEHFAVGTARGRLVLLHALPPRQVDNDVAAMLGTELFAPGWAGGADTFERLLTGVVLTCHDDALTSWEWFYRATLTRLAELIDDPSDEAASDDAASDDAASDDAASDDAASDDGVSANGTRPDAALVPEGALAGFAPVYRRAETLLRDAVTRSLLDLGTCFGFFPLRLATGHAGTGVAVQAGDISPGTCALLSRVSVRLGAPVPVLVCDAACVPLPDASVDTVTLLHVLEHVEAEHGEAMVAEALRLARRRVIVAVPLEEEPDAAFGHLRTLDLAGLADTGTRVTAGGPWRARVDEFHGGWLVLDRLLPPTRATLRRDHAQAW